MKVKCTDSNRELILRIMETELRSKAVYDPLPEFSYTVAYCKLQRDGFIIAEDSRAERLFQTLSYLDLCDFPFESEKPDEGEIFYDTHDCSGTAYTNILCIFSARQRLLNRALDTGNAFYVSEKLILDLLAHPPETIPEFLRALYGRDDEYTGICFRREYISFPGFRKGHPEEKYIHRQLADLIMENARSRLWIKPFTKNVRNKKYALHYWINSIGMIGEEYADARAVMLGRLYGTTRQRKIPNNKGGR